LQTETPTDSAQALAAELQRLILFSSDRGAADVTQVAVFNGCDPDGLMIQRVRAQLDANIELVDGSAAGRFSEEAEAHAASAAVALALAGVATENGVVNFLNPRIGRVRPESHKKLVGWAAFVGVAALIALGAVIAGWRSDVADIAAYTEQLELMRDDITAAREIVGRVSYARSWMSQEPYSLDCLRELTSAFPQEPRVWASSLLLPETGQATLVGKAVDEESFYEVLDRIKGNAAFSDVRMMHIRNAGRDTTVKEFAISFRYQGVK
jgi:hypothetical protein